MKAGILKFVLLYIAFSPLHDCVLGTIRLDWEEAFPRSLEEALHPVSMASIISARVIPTAVIPPALVRSGECTIEISMMLPAASSEMLKHHVGRVLTSLAAAAGIAATDDSRVRLSVRGGSAAGRTADFAIVDISILLPRAAGAGAAEDDEESALF